MQAPGLLNLLKDLLCPTKQVESSKAQPGDLACTGQIQDLAKNLKWTNVTAATKADNLWSISSMFKAAQAAPLQKNPKACKEKMNHNKLKKLEFCVAWETQAEEQHIFKTEQQWWKHLRHLWETKKHL